MDYQLRGEETLHLFCSYRCPKPRRGGLKLSYNLDVQNDMLFFHDWLWPRFFALVERLILDD